MLPSIFILVILVFSFNACTKKIIKSPTAEELILFPSPPDSARIQFLTYINSSENIARPQSGFKKFFLGEEEPRPINRPYGIQVTKNSIYICDPGIGGLEIINLKKGTFEYFKPSGKGQLKLPLNCFVDEFHYLFVADGERRQVVVFDHMLKYVTALGGTRNFKPTGVWVKDEKIYVANVSGHKIFVYDLLDYNLIDSFPNLSPESKGYLNQPVNISSSNENIYVTDFGGFNIKSFSPDGSFKGITGNYGKGFGQFTRPKGIALDKDENLYAVDAAFENVQIFNKDGALLMFFGGHGNMSLPAGVAISYDNLDYFEPYVYKDFNLKFLIYVTNQFGPNKIGVYGFVEEKTSINE